MARGARIVVPGYPHHVTQRGNRKQKTFFLASHYHFYIGLMAEWCKRCGIEIWAYCLMPNHVHLIAVPSSEDGLRKGIGEAHRRYTARVNSFKSWRGHLWQGRFASYVLDDEYLLTATRYIELNPVVAKIVKNPAKYRWSSARPHMKGEDDKLVKVSPMLEIVSDWKAFLADDVSPKQIEQIRAHESSGRPIGSDTFLTSLEKKLDRVLRPRKKGRPKKDGRPRKEKH